MILLLVIIVVVQIVLVNSLTVYCCLSFYYLRFTPVMIFNSSFFTPRYDFRSRVARVLQLEMARVTILPDSPRSAADGRCQQVSFMVSGEEADVTLTITATIRLISIKMKIVLRFSATMALETRVNRS